MGHIQANVLTYVFCKTSPIDHKPEARQGKMAGDVSHLYQFINVQACNTTFY